MKKLVFLLLTVVLAIALWMATMPAPIDALAWQPPADNGLVAAFAPNQRLREARLIADGAVNGGEDVAIDGQGRVYAGTADGLLLRVTATGEVETFADTGGRPLGLHFDKDGRLWVADAFAGLLSVTPDGVITKHLSKLDGRPLRFGNDLDIAADGRIYFTDSSRFEQPDYMLDAFEARPHGRLIRYDPATGQAETLLDGLYFANGVALASDDSFVLVNETWRYRITRLWLSGPRAGSSEVVVDNLPGFPDGIAADGEGGFWLALPTVRNVILDFAHPYPWLKNLIARLPQWLQPAPARYGLIAHLNANVEIDATLHDPGGEQVWEITSVQPANGKLYLGTLHNQWLAELAL